VCKQAPGKIAGHQAINDVIARAITAAGVPVTKEPVSLTRLDGKRPDGLTLIPWLGGKPLTWDVTVVSTLAESHTYIPRHTLPTALLKPLQPGRSQSTLPVLQIISGMPSSSVGRVFGHQWLSRWLKFRRSRFKSR